jgi:hypothetical protein
MINTSPLLLHDVIKTIARVQFPQKKEKIDSENESHKTESSIQSDATNDDDDDALFDDDIDWNAVESCVKNVYKCPGHSVTFPIGKQKNIFEKI